MWKHKICQWFAGSLVAYSSKKVIIITSICFENCKILAENVFFEFFKIYSF